MNGKMIGDILREARLGKQLQLTDIEKGTGIEVQHLLALELDQFSLVPSDQVESYLRSYAEMVGLDADEIYNQYQKQASFQSTLPHFSSKETISQETEVSEEPVPMERMANRRRRRSHREVTQKKSKLPAILLSLLSLAILVVVGYFIFKQWPFINTAQETSKETTSSTTDATTTTETTTVTEAVSSLKMTVQEDGSSLATVQTNKESVDIIFTLKEGESWVGLSDDTNGEQGTILTGEQTKFTASVNKGSSSLVTIGLPQSVTVTMDGQEVDLTNLVNYSPATFTLTVE